jgi:RNA polymerase sigma-70 factor (ECF subfamily)
LPADPPKAALATLHLVPSSSEEPSDAVLVERARAGDRLAERAIYLRHVGYVTALCIRLLGQREEAEDTVHDTFVDVLEQLPSLREPERLRAWIRRIAAHKVHRRFRKRKLLRALGLYEPSSSALPLLPAVFGLSAEQRADLGRVSAVLAELADEQRAAWVLRHVDGQTLEQTAELCGCSLATIKRRLAAADAQVRKHVSFEEARDE